MAGTTRHHNVTGAITKELLAAGNDYRVSKISLANVEGTNTVSVDLWIEKQYTSRVTRAGLSGKFYFFKDLDIPAGVTLMHNISFDNKADEFSLYVKLTAASGTPAVDIILY
tara:strand:- start:46 stop:381 length:336 start_codon:yes stop_codon:yes gene_type:complete